MARASKLTPEQKVEIVKLNSENKVPYGVLAAMYGVSSATIMRVCRPDYYARQKESNRKYQAQNTEQIYEQRKKQQRNYSLSFNIETDREVISFLDGLDNTQDYVRQKVLEDVRKQNEDKGSED